MSDNFSIDPKEFLNFIVDQAIEDDIELKKIPEIVWILNRIKAYIDAKYHRKFYYENAKLDEMRDTHSDFSALRNEGNALIGNMDSLLSENFETKYEHFKHLLQKCIPNETEQVAVHIEMSAILSLYNNLRFIFFSQFIFNNYFDEGKLSDIDNTISKAKKELQTISDMIPSKTK